ncbi:GTPase-activating protein GYP5 [Nakaseomyces bracarensis]|uniref:GTPase-activating protein GYP5 n=1 Tax=Nakaseomyces bracarensis TaxID=273131 RepID=A0ABR4NRF7_9SACH
MSETEKVDNYESMGDSISNNSETPAPLESPQKGKNSKKNKKKKDKKKQKAQAQRETNENVDHELTSPDKDGPEQIDLVVDTDIPTTTVNEDIPVKMSGSEDLDIQNNEKEADEEITEPKTNEITGTLDAPIQVSQPSNENELLSADDTNHEVKADETKEKIENPHSEATVMSENKDEVETKFETGKSLTNNEEQVKLEKLDEETQTGTETLATNVEPIATNEISKLNEVQKVENDVAPSLPTDKKKPPALPVRNVEMSNEIPNDMESNVNTGNEKDKDLATFTFSDDETEGGIQMSIADDVSLGPESPKLPPRNIPEHSTRTNVDNLVNNNSSEEINRGPPPALPSRELKTRTKKKAVPPPLEEELKSESFREEFERTKISTANHQRYGSTSSIRQSSIQIESTADVNLIANRYRKTSSHFLKEKSATKELLEQGQNQLKSNYTSFLENLKEEKTDDKEEIEKEDLNKDEQKELLKTDWTFWTHVVNDFPAIASQEPEKLEKYVIAGIPEQIRGIIWQMMTNSKSKEMEEIYQTLLPEVSPHEAAIKRDLKRTNFISDDKMESLYNIIKVYTVFDPEVGYTQGMAFVIAPLLLNCDSEAEAFGLLIGLMKNYGLREFYLPDMPGLMVMLYQFDRVIEENSPLLSNHLNREGVRASMYATQWFLTMFAYRFPLTFVLRILDVVFVEGVESLLKFAVNLMLKNEDKIISLKFDKLLPFLKEGLFEIYSQPDTDDSYDVDQFVQDAIRDVIITPLSLQRYSAEYKEIHQLEHQREIQYESMRIKNHQLNREYHKLQSDYNELNLEHESIANELIENRLKYQMVLDENSDLQNNINQLREQLEMERTAVHPDSNLTNDLEVDLRRATERNTEVMRENLKLEDRVEELKLLIKELKMANRMNQPSLGANIKSSAGAGWSGFKKVFRK